MYVDDTSELLAVLVAFIRSRRSAECSDGAVEGCHSRQCQEMGDHLEDIGVAPGRIVKSRSIDQGNLAPIEQEGWCNLNDIRTGTQPSTDPHLGAANSVDELQ